eukprot:TRINITY_DN26294_c0_g1_i1.p1 TRINITY_DN26294_c0_g1~~TRINITY_DN26294_c0_g1_i1.p1  ORF type:complete len:231 (-),score=40.47 TRINITY_DN26294_c0_g1_i1:94-786(-)
MIRRPPRSTLSSSSAASDVYKRQQQLSRAPYHPAPPEPPLQPPNHEPIGVTPSELMAAIGAKQQNSVVCHRTGLGIEELVGDMEPTAMLTSSLLRERESGIGRTGGVGSRVIEVWQDGIRAGIAQFEPQTLLTKAERLSGRWCLGLVRGESEADGTLQITGLVWPDEWLWMSASELMQQLSSQDDSKKQLGFVLGSFGGGLAVPALEQLGCHPAALCSCLLYTSPSPRDS